MRDRYLYIVFINLLPVDPIYSTHKQQIRKTKDSFLPIAYLAMSEFSDHCMMIITMVIQFNYRYLDTNIYLFLVYIRKLFMGLNDQRLKTGMKINKYIFTQL